MFKEFIYLVKLLFHNKPKDCKKLEIMEMKYFPFSGYLAMTWCGKLITKHPEKLNEETIIHETIHLKQAQQYSVWILYYLKYFNEWLKGKPFIKPYKSAYYTIPFEVEAYANENDKNYIIDYNPINLKEKYTLNNRKELFKKYQSFQYWKQYIQNL